MPIYEYLCESCHKQAEFMQKFTDPAPAKCEACGKGPMVKQLSRTSFALKGTGWYVTDFKGGSSKPPSSADSKDAEAGSSGKASAGASDGASAAVTPSPTPAKTTSTPD